MENADENDMLAGIIQQMQDVDLGDIAQGDLQEIEQQANEGPVINEISLEHDHRDELPLPRAFGSDYVYNAVEKEMCMVEDRATSSTSDKLDSSNMVEVIVDKQAITYESLVSGTVIEGCVRIKAPSGPTGKLRDGVDLMIILNLSDMHLRFNRNLYSAVRFIVDQLSDVDRFAVIGYAKDAFDVTPNFQYMTSSNKRAAERALWEVPIVESKDCNLGDALFRASKWLNGAGELNRRTNLMVVSGLNVIGVNDVADVMIDSFFSSLMNTTRLTVSTFLIDFSEKVVHGMDAIHGLTSPAHVDVLKGLAERSGGQFHFIPKAFGLCSAVAYHLSQEVLDIAMENVVVDLADIGTEWFLPGKMHVTVRPNGKYLKCSECKFKVGNMAYGAQRDFSFKVGFKLHEAPPLPDPTMDEAQIEQIKSLDEDELDCCLICHEELQERAFTCTNPTSNCKFALCWICCQDDQMKQLPMTGDGKCKCPSCNLEGIVWRPQNFKRGDFVMLLTPVLYGDCLFPKGLIVKIADREKPYKEDVDFLCKLWRVDICGTTLLYLPETILTNQLPSIPNLEKGDPIIVTDVLDSELNLKAGTRGTFVRYVQEPGMFAVARSEMCVVKAPYLRKAKYGEVVCHEEYTINARCIRKISSYESDWLGRFLPIQIGVSYLSHDSEICRAAGVANLPVLRAGMMCASATTEERFYLGAQDLRNKMVSSLTTGLSSHVLMIMTLNHYKMVAEEFLKRSIPDDVDTSPLYQEQVQLVKSIDAHCTKFQETMLGPMGLTQIMMGPLNAVSRALYGSLASAYCLQRASVSLQNVVETPTSSPWNYDDIELSLSGSIHHLHTQSFQERLRAAETLSTPYIKRLYQTEPDKIDEPPNWPFVEPKNVK